jgi:hypothetical protein
MGVQQELKIKQEFLVTRGLRVEGRSLLISTTS